MDVSSLISLYSSTLLNQNKSNSIDTSLSTGDFSSYLTAALGSTDHSLTNSLTSLLNNSASLDTQSNNLNSSQSIDNTLGTVFQSTFQNKLASNLSIAKANLQTNYQEILKEIAVNSTPDLLAKKEKLEANIQSLDSFISTNLSTNNTSSTFGQSSSNSASLTSSASTSYDSLNSIFTSNSNSSDEEDVFGTMLTNSFQTQLISNLTLAKSKMQKSYVDYVARMGENPSESAIARMNEMKTNMSSIDSFLTAKSAESNAKQAYSQSNNSNITQLNSMMNGLY